MFETTMSGNLLEGFSFKFNIRCALGPPDDGTRRRRLSYLWHLGYTELRRTRWRCPKIRKMCEILEKNRLFVVLEITLSRSNFMDYYLILLCWRTAGSPDQLTRPQPAY